MIALKKFEHPKTDITYRALGNFLKGKGNDQAIDRNVETVNGQYGRATESSIDKLNAIDYLLDVEKARVFIYSKMYVLANYDSSDGFYSFDCFIIEKVDGNYNIYAMSAGDGTHEGILKSIDRSNVLSALNQFDEKNSFYLGDNTSSFHFIAATPENYFLSADAGNYQEWDEIPFDIKEPVSNNTNSETNKGNKEMATTKIATIVDTNKSAAVTVAKIEAGRIGIKQAVKVIKPAVPMMARGYLDTAIGELVVANLFKFAVDNFASSNKQAAIVADAMLQGAMLSTVQSLNIEKLVAEVMEKVDFSKFTDNE